MKRNFLERMTDGVTEDELTVFQQVVDKMADNIGIRTDRLG